MNKAVKIVVGLILGALIVCSGIKTYNVKKGLDNLHKCYLVESQMLAFAVTGYEQTKFSLEGEYIIQGYLSIFPFRAIVKQSELESQVLPIAEEIPCQREE